MSNPYYYEPGQKAQNLDFKADFSDLWIILPITLGGALVAVILLLPFCVHRYCKECCLRSPNPWCWDWAESCVACFNPSTRRQRAMANEERKASEWEAAERRRQDEAQAVAECRADRSRTARVQYFPQPAYIPPSDTQPPPAGTQFSPTRQIREVKVFTVERRTYEYAV